MKMDETANAMLVDHAAGALPEALSLAVATHVALNTEARAKYEALNQVGGVLLEESDLAPVAQSSLDAIFASIEADDRASMPKPAPDIYDSRTRALVPEPLRSYLPASLDKLKWKRRGGGVAEAEIEIGSKQHHVSLLKIEPGKAIPEHSHRGNEYTVILDGAYTDGQTRVATGDFACSTPDDTHSPIADSQDGCLCLAVTDAPLRFTGMFGWVVNPFLKH